MKQFNRSLRRFGGITLLTAVTIGCQTMEHKPQERYSDAVKFTAEVDYPPDFSCHKILSDFWDKFTSDGLERSTPHSGIDFIDDFVISPADGIVVGIYDCKNPADTACELVIYHDGKTVNVIGDGSSFLSYFVHLKKIDNRNSTRKYVKEGQTVKRGQIIAEKGKTGGFGLRKGSIAHTDWTLFKNDTGKGVFHDDMALFYSKETGYIYIERSKPHTSDKLETRVNSDDVMARLVDGRLVNPHFYWAQHPLDRKIKYIPQFREGFKYDRGFTYPGLCR